MSTIKALAPKAWRVGATETKSPYPNQTMWGPIAGEKSGLSGLHKLRAHSLWAPLSTLGSTAFMAVVNIFLAPPPPPPRSTT